MQFCIASQGLSSSASSLNITSADFLANMDNPHFTKSRGRWNSFAQAVDSEVSTPLHSFLFLLLSPNVGRIATISCPDRLDNKSIWTTNDRDAPNILTQNCFCRISLVHVAMVSSSSAKTSYYSMLLRIASTLGRGSPNTGTFVVQVFHWFYVGSPRATTSYRACVNVLLSSEKVHIDISLLKKMIRVHSLQSVFDRCSHRSQREQTQIYTVSSLNRSKLREQLQLSLVSVA